MKVDLNSQLQSLLTLDTGKPLARTLAVGQVLQAKVVGRSTDGTVTLRDNRGVQMAAHSTLAFKRGEQLTLRVESLGHQPVLRLLTQPSGDAVELAALRHVLPKQQPLAPLMNQLRAVSQGGTGLDFQPSQQLSIAARQVHTLVRPLADVLVPARLQQAILNSGLFLESRLGASTGATQHWSVTQDLKAGLLRLSAVLENHPNAAANPTQRSSAETGALRTGLESPPVSPGKGGEALRELLRQTEGVLAGVQVRQLSSTGPHANGVTAWHIEVPVTNNDQTEVLPLQFERETDEDDDQKAIWSVKLAVELETLGKLYARVVLAAGTVSTTLWAEQPETAALANRHLASLQDAFVAAGLPVGVVCCQQGAPQDGQSLNAWPALLRVTV
jgi:hypothetical protein